MEASSQIDYKKLLSDLIKKQIEILGRDITLAKVKNVVGIKVDENGEVSELMGDPKVLLDKLTSEFLELSSLVVKRTIDSILSEYSIKPQEVKPIREQIPSSPTPTIPDTSTANPKSSDLENNPPDIQKITTMFEAPQTPNLTQDK